MKLTDFIANVPDFPKKGIQFKDITPLLQDGYAFNYTVELMAKYCKANNIDVICGPESRGFIFGSAVAALTHTGFVPVRKPNKLPRESISQTYALEYGEDQLCMHKDAIKPGQRVVIIDDLIATGGTIEAIIKMVEKLGGVVVGVCVLIELEDLHARDVLKGYDLYSILKY